jgi:hypothetical protein
VVGDQENKIGQETSPSLRTPRKELGQEATFKKNSFAEHSANVFSAASHRK